MNVSSATKALLVASADGSIIVSTQCDNSVPNFSYVKSAGQQVVLLIWEIVLSHSQVYSDNMLLDKTNICFPVKN